LTKEIFEWIGSTQEEGVDTYLPPKNFDWKWGNDDGGEKLKTLKVQPKLQIRDNQELVEIIKISKELNKLRNQLGYFD